MELYFEDTRPLSALRMKVFEKTAVIGGLITAVVATMLPSVILAVRISGDADQVMRQQADAENEIPTEQEPEVIEAAFVQLGRHFDPRELPDRQTATSSLAQQRPDPNAVSMHTREEWDGGIPPPNAYASTLDRLGNRADYVQTMLAPELEGTNEGTEDGRNSRGSLYAGQLYTLFRRGWNPPNSITDAEYASLSATVSLVIGENLKTVSIRITRSSGNADFDRSIESRISEIRESNPTFPEPPTEERARFIGQPIAIRFVPPNRVRRSTHSTTNNSVLDNLGAGY